MIAPEVVQQIRRLLAERKLSQRKIARLMRVSRGTVGAIAAGKRPDYDSLSTVREDRLPQHNGTPRRCAGCGGLVYLPCRLCGLRAELTGSSRPPPARLPARPDEPLQLELTAEHRVRYEEIRARRTANAQQHETL